MHSRTRRRPDWLNVEESLFYQPRTDDMKLWPAELSPTSDKPANSHEIQMHFHNSQCLKIPPNLKFYAPECVSEVPNASKLGFGRDPGSDPVKGG